VGEPPRDFQTFVGQQDNAGSRASGRRGREPNVDDHAPTRERNWNSAALANDLTFRGVQERATVRQCALLCKTSSVAVVRATDEPSRDYRTTRSREMDIEVEKGSHYHQPDMHDVERGRKRPTKVLLMIKWQSRRGSLYGVKSYRGRGAERRAGFFLAPDLIGFGRSEKQTDKGWYK